MSIHRRPRSVLLPSALCGLSLSPLTNRSHQLLRWADESHAEILEIDKHWLDTFFLPWSSNDQFDHASSPFVRFLLGVTARAWEDERRRSLHHGAQERYLDDVTLLSWMKFCVVVFHREFDRLTVIVSALRASLSPTPDSIMTFHAHHRSCRWCLSSSSYLMRFAVHRFSLFLYCKTKSSLSSSFLSRKWEFVPCIRHAGQKREREMKKKKKSFEAAFLSLSLSSYADAYSSARESVWEKGRTEKCQSYDSVHKTSDRAQEGRVMDIERNVFGVGVALVVELCYFGRYVWSSLSLLLLFDRLVSVCV